MQNRFGSASTKRIRRRSYSLRLPEASRDPPLQALLSRSLCRSLPGSIHPPSRGSVAGSSRPLSLLRCPLVISALKLSLLSLLPRTPSPKALSNPIHSRRKRGFRTLPRNACSKLPGRNWCRQNRKERVKTQFWVSSRTGKRQTKQHFTDQKELESTVKKDKMPQLNDSTQAPALEEEDTFRTSQKGERWGGSCDRAMRGRIPDSRGEIN
ncbi:hypothetical protein MRB53_034492 [Persea americana]|uniref:Uncharacterized protein n=1 Tax=Persea americana TaxID=3435 RepID=A0ACC2K214_PERAE|nr:hypothetical protein MRB53_034492 [Persea americana]